MGVGIKERKIFFLINPHAGSGRAAKWWEDLRLSLDEQGFVYTWQYSYCVASAKTQVQDAVIQGAEAVVMVGGDGSLYEALNGLVKDDALIRKNTVFVAWPAGSACDFVRSLDYGQITLLDLLKFGKIEYIDICRCAYQSRNGQAVEYFINACDVGTGADTCIAVNAGRGRIKRLLKNGHLAFKITALQVLMRYKYCHIDVYIDDSVASGEFIIVGCGNGSYMGGGMMLFPQASLDSGKVEVFLVRRMSRLRILRVFSKVYDGTVSSIPGVEYYRGRKIKIVSERPLHLELDGEVPGTTDAEITILPKVLPLLLPDNC